MPHTPSPIHPGVFLRSVLPPGLSVTKAAELVGVGRPALSNLLNGKVALTSAMAQRIEKAFGQNAQELLAMQALYEESLNRERAKEIAVRSYVPKFLSITARQISAWSEQIDARSQLPALLRRLVNSTGVELSKVDFPAFDNAQRRGWDGYVSAGAATPWIPRGNSGWEFGCNANVEKKADADYDARTGLLSAAERAETTFVFVTPRNWIGKEAWAESKRRLGTWKEIRALDASDIEQWLEQSVATQAWFSERSGSRIADITTPEDFWAEWAGATRVPMSKVLFRSAVKSAEEALQSWLSKPPTVPFIIAADSEGEGLAFVACALETYGGSAGEFYDRAVVLQTVDALRRATATAPDFIAIVTSPEVEIASASAQKTHHLLIVRNRNGVSGDANFNLDLVDDATYRDALSAMGLPEEDYQRYVRDTAYSPTILRRYLSTIPAIRYPAWSTDRQLARNLIPLNFAGAWDSEAESDREVLRLLADCEYSTLEQTISDLGTVSDSSVWSIGKYRGVTSKIDVLFATHSLVTKRDLDIFFLVAEIVLSETDPSLDLPKDKQWAANIYGKTREHSAALRSGLRESLVLLAVHGNHLFRNRLGIDVQACVDAVVRNLLLPLDGRTWASQRGDLPGYAEAAPSVFLEILEADLASPEPKVFTLLEPVGRDLFSDCARTGLLWALETLAWLPERLVRVSLILAKLAAVKIDDNWASKPEGSLEAIYRAWMPQTAATIEQRNEALAVICRRHPEVGWKLCVDQFGADTGIGHYSARPRWRNDASSAGQTVKTWNEVWAVADEARQIALGWPRHTEDTLGDLVERVSSMPQEDQDAVWDLVNDWVATNPDDHARHKLRERVRQTTFTRRARIRKEAGADEDRAREAYELLAPRDPIVRNLWLFGQHWVDESADDLDGEEINYEKREARISALRKAAIGSIWNAYGYDGVLRLSAMGNADGVIGWHLANELVAEGLRLETLYRLAGQLAPADITKIDNIISGFLMRLDASDRDALVTKLMNRFLVEGAPDKAIRILKCGPFRAGTWKHLSSLPDDWHQRYWRETYVRWERQDEEEFNILVDRLLDVGRARAAFGAVHMDFDKVESHRLLNLLRSLALEEGRDGYRFPPQHEISDAFESLDARKEISRDELVQLEFTYAKILDRTKYGIRNLQEAICKDPDLFVQLIGFVYRRKDGGEDPPEWEISDERRRSNVASLAYSVLHKISKTPGTKSDESIDSDKLRWWVEQVRILAKNVGRSEIADHAIGELLSKCPSAPDGVWPCEPVREILDLFASQEMAEGVSIGRYNSRGVHWRGPNGDDERAIASQYRSWSKATSYYHPFTANLLERIALTYDREGHWHDTEASIRKRLNY